MQFRRSLIPGLTENYNLGDTSHKLCGTTVNQQLRHPFAVLAHNLHIVKNLSTKHLGSISKEVTSDAQSNKTQGTFLRKDDPKLAALMQQAELLSSLAQKVNTDNTSQSLENAWKVLQEFLNRNKDSESFKDRVSDDDFQVENFKDFVEDLRSSNEGSHPSWRQPNLYEESPSSSEYSTGSTILPQPVSEKTEQTQSEIVEMHEGIGSALQPVHIGEENVGEYEKDVLSIVDRSKAAEVFPSYNEQGNKNEVSAATSSAEFSSPLQVTPLFRSLAEGIPTPQFSESERNFLLKTLGMESPSADPATNQLSSPPPCKRVLLHSL